MRIEYLHKVAAWMAGYVRNELTAEEKMALNKWLKETPEREVQLRHMCSMDFLKKMRQAELSYQTEEAYERFRFKLRKKKKIQRFNVFVRIAAVVILLIGGGWWSGKYFFTSESSSGLIACGSSIARLTLADGQMITLESGTERLLESGGVSVNIANGQIAYSGKENAEEEVYNLLEIPRRGEFRLTLEDGTRVWLNAETELRYPASFGTGKRQVYLKGEAYFEVTPDAGRPFVVDLNADRKVMVLGTSFHVHNYPDEATVYTTLVDGKVNVYDGQEEMELLPGEQAVMEANVPGMEKRKVNVNDYIAWKNQRFVFRKQRLEDIMNTLARWYDVEVYYAEEEVKDVTFSGNLERYDSLNQIINMLGMTQMATFELKGRKVYIRMGS